ncbi:YmfL family putative regulatory protein [Escherichia coli]
MGNHHWKVEKQPEWYVKAVRKTIAALPGGYAEAAEWLDVTENALFNRLRADGDQIFPLGWAMVLQRAAGTHYIADAVAQSAGGVFVSLPEIEEVENADINQRLLEVIEQIGSYSKQIRSAIEDGVPKTPRTQTTDNGKQNTYFSSLDNMVAQGNVLPVLYGEMRVGSRVISQEVSTRDEGNEGQMVVIGRQVNNSRHM